MTIRVQPASDDESDASDTAVKEVLRSQCVQAALSLAQKSGDSGFADQACVKRYLRAYEGNVPKAARALANTIQWRIKERPAETDCPACERCPFSHYMRIIGTDAFGRSVIYSCFHHAMDREDVEPQLRHVTRCLEDACAVMAARAERLGIVAENCVWLIDFHGFSVFRDGNPKVGMLAVRLLAHYPERLGRCLLIDAPRVFSGTMRLLKRLINARTESKVFFVNSRDGTLEANLERFATTSLKKWVLAEVQDNRRVDAGRKYYWLEPIVTCAQKPPHDPRGDIDFVVSPEYKFSSTCRVKARQLSHPDGQKHFHGKQAPDMLEDNGSIKLQSAWWREPVNLAVTAAAIAMTAAAGREVVSPERVAAVAVIVAAAVLVGASGLGVLRQPRQQSRVSCGLHRPEPTPSPQLATEEQDERKEVKQIRHVPRMAEVPKERECGWGCWG